MIFDPSVRKYVVLGFNYLKKLPNFSKKFKIRVARQLQGA